MLWQKEANAETITEELSILWLYAAYEQIASSGTICSRKHIYFSFCNYLKDQRLLFLQIFAVWVWLNCSEADPLSIFLNHVHINTSSGDSPLLREQPHPDSPWQEDLPHQEGPAKHSSGHFHSSPQIPTQVLDPSLPLASNSAASKMCCSLIQLHNETLCSETYAIIPSLLAQNWARRQKYRE